MRANERYPVVVENPVQPLIISKPHTLVWAHLEGIGWLIHSAVADHEVAAVVFSNLSRHPKLWQASVTDLGDVPWVDDPAEEASNQVPMPYVARDWSSAHLVWVNVDGMWLVHSVVMSAEQAEVVAEAIDTCIGSVMSVRWLPLAERPWEPRKQSFTWRPLEAR